jgi:hypothetical protein
VGAQPKLYWHFAAVDDEGTPRLGYGDGRQVRVGETLRVEGTPVPCEHGLHASEKLWDALFYARGDKLALCRVTLGGEMVDDGDKVAANERTVVAMLDATTTDKLLRDFTRWCALQVVDLWDAPNVVRRYLETGDESLRAATKAAIKVAARNADRDEAWSVTWDAAWAVARDAARDAAWNSVRDVIRDAARDAAKYAARSATSYAARGMAGSVIIREYAAELERRAVVLFDE